MRVEAYLAVGGDERTIRALQEEANIPEADVRSFPKAKAEWSITGEDNPWGWATAPVPLDIADPDVGLKALLYVYRPIFPIIKKYMGPKTAVCIQMVTRYRPGADVPGLSLSYETISLMAELGAAFDNDVVWLLDGDTESPASAE